MEYYPFTASLDGINIPSKSQVASPDVGRMGIEVLSFTIKDVYDTVTYLASLGKFLRYIKIMYAITIGLAIAKYQAEIITDESK